MSPQPTALLQRLRALRASLPFILMQGLVSLGFTPHVMRAMGRRMQDRTAKAKVFAGYQPTRHDVIVSTYSKSGTNWMLQMAYQIAHHGQGEFEHIHQVVPWPDAPMPGIVPLSERGMQAAAPTGLRVIKTHLESPYVPYHPDAKYIVVVRDPKEVLVSSYFFSHKIFALQKPLSVAEWLDSFLTPDRFLYGSWAEHLASYWPWRARPNVLLLMYHEMKADPARAAQQVAALMGVPLTEAQLAQVVARSDFAYMKQIDLKFMPQVPFTKPRGGMIRRGQSGGASELLTPEQQASVDAVCAAALQRLGCDFPYADCFQPQPLTPLATAYSPRP